MIKSTLENQVATIVIDRPEKKNALNPQMYADMAKAIEQAPMQNAKVVLIKGTNGCFTSGNDVAEFAKTASGADRPSETLRFMRALIHCPLPVVAQVEGLAIGIGSTLLLHCDFVLCHKNTSFCMPFVNLGLVPEYASSYILPRIAGHLSAAELLMLGNPFDAEKALKCGFVSAIYQDNLEQHVDKLIASLLSKPSFAVQQTKSLLRNDQKKVGKHLERELEVFVDALQSPAAKEAFDAFINKRPINKEVFAQ